MSFDKALFQAKFEKTLDHFGTDISTIRTGRASAQMLDNVTVEAYGSRMKLVEVASISVPDPSLIVISPWDKSLLGIIEKAIQAAQLNLNPIVDGSIVRLPVPSLTQDRRQELVKLLHQKAESSRVLVRNVRVDIKKDLEKQADLPGVSEDDIKADLKNLEDMTKLYVEKIDSMTKLKETELTKI